MSTSTITLGARYAAAPALRGSHCAAAYHGITDALLRAWRRRDAVVCVCALVFGCWQFAGATYIHAKADLAQVLLERAWARTLATGHASKPWPWADTNPVARLRVSRLGVQQIVLSGDAGRTLAFGPGWAESSAAPGTTGNSVISGHRDTHFAFLRELHNDDRIEIETTAGRWSYRVAALSIVDARSNGLLSDTDRPMLTLVTCYPFAALVSGGPLRYVVSAERITDGADSAR